MLQGKHIRTALNEWIWASLLSKMTHYGLQTRCDLAYLSKVTVYNKVQLQSGKEHNVTYCITQMLQEQGPISMHLCNILCYFYGCGHIAGYTVQQNTSKSAEVAVAVCPHPGLGLHVHINLVSFLKNQHYPIRAVISDIWGSWVFCGAHNSLAILVQE